MLLLGFLGLLASPLHVLHEPLAVVRLGLQPFLGAFLLNFHKSPQVGELDVLHLHVVGLLGEFSVEVVLLRFRFQFLVALLFLGDAPFQVQLVALLHFLGILRRYGQPLILRQVGVSQLLLIELRRNLIHALGVLLVINDPGRVCDAVQGFLSLPPLLFRLELVNRGG